MKSIGKIFYSLLIACTIITACADGKKENIGNAEVVKKDSTTDQVTITTDQYNVAAIALGKVQMRNLSSIIKVNGVIDVEPQNMVSISAPLGGYVKSAGLLPGAQVRKGEVIAVIENAAFIDIQQDYLESSSRMVFLGQELARQQELRKEEVNSAKTLQQVLSEYNMMRAKINALQQKLSLIGIGIKTLEAGKISKTSNLYAPITGYVTASNVNAGKYVQPSDVLFELVDKSDLHLALNVFEKDVSKIITGQRLKFSLASEADYNRTASIFLIGKLTAKEGTIPVHCHLDVSNDETLLPGMYVKAMIATRTDDVQALPVQAVVQSDAKNYVFVQTDTANGKATFRMIPVILGTEQEGFVAITFPENFNAAGANVVIKGAYALLSAIKNVEEEE